MSKRFDELQYLDDFMFGAVMENTEICKGVIETILDVKLSRVKLIETQKSYKDTSEARGIRLDAYVEDEEGTIYSIEMQAMPKRNLAKRARYYQSNIDVSVLKEGEDFEDLPQSYVIFICNFDPFDLNLAKYTYTNRCEEQLDHKLEDGTAKIFINAKGITENLTPELKAFVGYLSHPEEESNDPLVGAIEKEINKIKETPKRRSDFMTYTQAIYEAAREAAKEAAKEATEKAEKENEAKISEMIRNLMESMNLTFDQAMDALMIEETERKTYAKAIVKEN